MKRLLAAEFKEPSVDLLRLFAAHIYPGRAFTQRTREELSPLVAKATTQFINEQVRERLKTALGDDGGAVRSEVKYSSPIVPDSIVEEDSQDGIVTTEEELEGYRIVRAVVCGEVSAERVVGRDSKTYFAVLLDNNNRKPIARLWFNRKQKYLGVFDSNKVETRLPIESLEEIYRHAAQLRDSVTRYVAADSSMVPFQANSASLAPAEPAG
jgi:predicted type IV restriction endonuclease